MRRIANAEMRDAFLGWQCRIRQIAMREYGGQPLPGMRPSVSTRRGKSLSPGLIVLLLPLEPKESTAFFKYQVQKTNELQKTREAGIGYLGAEFFQLPELFSDAMAAIFQPRSPLAAEILKAKEVVLDSSSSTRASACSVPSGALASGMRRARPPSGRPGSSSAISPMTATS